MAHATRATIPKPTSKYNGPLNSSGLCGMANFCLPLHLRRLACCHSGPRQIRIDLGTMDSGWRPYPSIPIACAPSWIRNLAEGRRVVTMSYPTNGQPETLHLPRENLSGALQCAPAQEDLSSQLKPRSHPPFAGTDILEPESQHRSAASRDQWEPLIHLRFLSVGPRVIEECFAWPSQRGAAD